MPTQRARPRQPRRRPIVVPTFGKRLTALRGTRSRGVILRDVSAQYGLTLDRSTLLQYERGTVGSPDPAILWALSRIYHVTLEEMVRPLLQDRTRRTLPDAAAERPALDAEQLQVVEWFGQLDDDLRRASYIMLKRLTTNSAPHQTTSHHHQTTTTTARRRA